MFLEFLEMVILVYGGVDDERAIEYPNQYDC